MRNPFFGQLTFEKSLEYLRDQPKGKYREFAFIGRSNVGKSSLINALSHQNKLAKVSSVPGKTATLNYFKFPDGNYLVDLPGYGYAKKSKKERAKFEKIINDYIYQSPHLHYLFVLIDARHKPQAIDLEFLESVGKAEIPLAIVFTKVDKLKKQEWVKNLKVYEQTLADRWDPIPPYFETSSEKKLGLEDLQNFIQEFVD